MPISKEKKSEIYKKIADIISKNNGLVFVNFHGVNVHDAAFARRQMREAEVGFYVAKKTLIKKSLEEKSFQGKIPNLEGEIAIAYSKDPIASAREIYSCHKKTENLFNIVGGIFEGKFMNRDEMMNIAQIPPLQVLYGQFVNLIQSPIQRIVIALDAIAKSKI